MAGRRARLAQRRKAAGYSQEALAARLGVDRSTVVRWEAADTEPQPWLRPKLADAFGVTVEDLRELLDDVGVPRGPTSDRDAYLSELASDGQARQSRVVHALDVTGQTEVSDPEAEDLHALVAHYKWTLRSTPPAELHDELIGVRSHTATLLDGAHAANNRADLLVAAGWLSNLLALVTHDLNDRAAALVWCADADRCSREARYPELAGWAAQTRVRMSFYGGQAGEAVAHAQRGQRLAPVGTVVYAELLAQEMRAWALLGNSDKVSSMRRRAEKAIAKLSTKAPTQGAFSISLADEPPYTATSLLLLGRNKEAAEATRRVIATFYDPSATEGRREHPSGFARTHLILALALAGLGKLGEAHAAGCTALDAPRLVWPVGMLAGKLDKVLMRDFAGTTEARNYHEHFIVAAQQNPAVGGQVVR